MNRKDAMKNFTAFPIYGITAEAMSAGRDNYTVVKAMLEAGIRFIQYREKEKSGLARYEECLKLKELVASYGGTFIIDDFADLALAVDADGVHIGQDDLPPEKVRELLGPDKVIGLSTHSPEQLDKANAMGDIIDYVGVGPVHSTQTKKTAQPVGLEYVAYAVKNARVPFVAIGGLKENNIHEVRDAGAQVASVVSEITGAQDIVSKVRALALHMER